MLIRTPSSQQIVDHGWHGWSHRGSCSLWRCDFLVMMVLRRERVEEYQHVTRQHVTNIMGPPAQSISREDQLISQAISGTRSCYRPKTSKPRRGAKCHPGSATVSSVGCFERARAKKPIGHAEHNSSQKRAHLAHGSCEDGDELAAGAARADDRRGTTRGEEGECPDRPHPDEPERRSRRPAPFSPKEPLDGPIDRSSRR